MGMAISTGQHTLSEVVRDARDVVSTLGVKVTIHQPTARIVVAQPVATAPDLAVVQAIRQINVTMPCHADTVVAQRHMHTALLGAKNADSAESPTTLPVSVSLPRR